MKRLMLSGMLLLAAARLAVAQPQPLYQVIGSFNSPPQSLPQIDATMFDNEGTFNLSVDNFALAVSVGNNGAFIFQTSIPAFDFSDTLYYTNRGIMSCDAGFKFDYAPSTSGFRRMAANFGNANTGQIFAGSANSVVSSNAIFFAGIFNVLTAVPTLTVSASNVVSSGLLDVGAGGLMQLTGNSVNLKRGTLHVEGFDDTNVVLVLGAFGTFTSGTLGIFDNYQGIGKQTNQLSIANFTLPFPSSPLNKVTNSLAQPTFSFVSPPLATAFVNTNSVGPSNLCIQVVFINTNLPGISTDVRFANNVFPNIPFIPAPNPGFATPVIQWEAVITNNNGTGTALITNDLYLADIFGSFPTNYLVTNNFSITGLPQLAPYNFSFSRFFPDYADDILNPHGNATYNPQFLFSAAFPETNDYSAFGVTLAPVTTFPDPTIPGSTVTNTEGRIQINASSVLDLTSTKITGPNYLSLLSTNHYVGSIGARISSPYMDFALGSTNGSLTVSNLVAPYVPRFTGPIDMWSGRWTNIDKATGITNIFHVLIVNAQLSPTALPLVLNANLRSTNVTISDNLYIEQTLLVNAKNLTITSNAPDALNLYGQLNLFTNDIVWSASFPVLQNLTNFGLISAQNATYFEGLRQSPYYPSNFVEPYLSFVNHGLISTFGDVIAANYFENTGRGQVVTNLSFISTTSNQSAWIYSGAGPITVQATTALMTDGAIKTPSGDLNITAGTLLITNHSLTAGGAINLTVTGNLTDQGVSSSNGWSVNDGINLLAKPGTGDLLGTTVTNTSPAGLEVINTWAGNDLGPVVAGFTNNAALGRLILNGGDITSQFYFGGPDENQNYALYVDQIVLQNGATNEHPVNGIQNFTAFDMADNMKIYFADAVIGPFDISEKLNGANAGHLIWVPSYAGAFSSTNIVIAGTTNSYNRALAQSTDIDSNGNGVANGFDPDPFYTERAVHLTSAVTNQPTKSPVIKWTGLAGATNLLYFSTSPTNTNWQLVSNIVLLSTNGGTFKYYTTNVSGINASNTIILPASGPISVNDRVRTNGGYYKVQVKLPHQ